MAAQRPGARPPRWGVQDSPRHEGWPRAERQRSPSCLCLPGRCHAEPHVAGAPASVALTQCPLVGAPAPQRPLGQMQTPGRDAEPSCWGHGADCSGPVCSLGDTALYYPPTRPPAGERQLFPAGTPIHPFYSSSQYTEPSMLPAIRGRAQAGVPTLDLRVSVHLHVSRTGSTISMPVTCA